MASDRKICVGAFVGAHGVRGQLRLRSFTFLPEDIFAYGPLTDESGKRSFSLKCVATRKDYFAVAMAGLEDREAAEALRGTKLFVDRSVLPATNPREYYEADLVGLTAQDLQGEPVGKIIAVHNYGAGTFIEIKPAQNDSFMLPFNDAFVPLMDIERGFASIIVPEDWLNKDKRDAP